MIQVQVWVPDAAKTVAVVQMVQGDSAITVATLRPGEQQQFMVYDGCSLRVVNEETPKS